ncbi:hypothetical protein GCM10010406_02730 [Streptomyces thermolineatus]|uniref:Uncharacterized protein n=1 Tax=Streptomyces thermolineatus TaxID=44033 RepID=A0ABN3KRT8_9ACTN
MITTSAAALTLLASESAEHENLNPYVTGIGAFLFLMVLLWITTRFNRD